MKQDLIIMSIAVAASLLFFGLKINELFALGMIVSLLLSIVYGYHYKGQKSGLHACIPVLLFVGWMVTTPLGAICTLVMFALFGSMFYYAYYTEMNLNPEPAQAQVSNENKKYCPACGMQMDASAGYCPKCGKEQ